MRLSGELNPVPIKESAAEGGERTFQLHSRGELSGTGIIVVFSPVNVPAEYHDLFRPLRTLPAGDEDSPL
jgi:hypothetical protein